MKELLLSCKVQRGLLIATGLGILLVSCIPVFAPVSESIRMLGAGLVGLGMKAPGHDD